MAICSRIDAKMVDRQMQGEKHEKIPWRRTKSMSKSKFIERRFEFLQLSEEQGLMSLRRTIRSDEELDRRRQVEVDE